MGGSIPAVEAIQRLLGMDAALARLRPGRTNRVHSPEREVRAALLHQRYVRPRHAAGRARQARLRRPRMSSEAAGQSSSGATAISSCPSRDAGAARGAQEEIASGSRRAGRTPRPSARRPSTAAALRHGRRAQCRNPALRRVNNPVRTSPTPTATVMRGARMATWSADLIGPDVKFHHCKINLKLPGARTEVGYHQDFAYDAAHQRRRRHGACCSSTTSTPSNGCLTVVPGSHKGPMLFAVRRRALHRRRRRPRSGPGCLAREVPMHRCRRQRLPDAHAACPRLGRQSRGPFARPLHLCLHRRRRLPARAATRWPTRTRA